MKSSTATVVRVLVIAFVCLVGIAVNAQQDSKKHFAKSAGTEANAPTSGPRASNAKVSDSFVIGADDVLSINVWHEPELSRNSTVRPDGKISVALLGELQAAGKTPKQLEDEIVTKLSAYITEPTVNVIVQEIRSRRFSVLGNVSHPGAFPLTNTTTVLDAIAVAGGFRDFAKQKSIYVLRSGAGTGEERLPFNYKDVIKGKNTHQNIELQPGDTVVVP